jgi:hypothetical protein
MKPYLGQLQNGGDLHHPAGAHHQDEMLEGIGTGLCLCDGRGHSLRAAVPDRTDAFLPDPQSRL